MPKKKKFTWRDLLPQFSWREMPQEREAPQEKEAPQAELDENFIRKADALIGKFGKKKLKPKANKVPKRVRRTMSGR